MAILFFFLMACGTTVIDLVEDCDVLASSVQPSEAAPGEQAAVTVSPVTTHWDTAVYLSGRPEPRSWTSPAMAVKAATPAEQGRRLPGV